MDAELEKYIDDHPSEFDVLPTGRVVCKVTSHEMEPKWEIVQKHLNGSKYKNKKPFFGLESNWYEKYAPYIVVDKKNINKMHCTVTGCKLNKIPYELDKHVQGKKFKRLLAIKLAAEQEAKIKEQKKREKKLAYEAKQAELKASDLAEQIEKESKKNEGGNGNGNGNGDGNGDEQNDGDGGEQQNDGDGEQQQDENNKNENNTNKKKRKRSESGGKKAMKRKKRKKVVKSSK
eukprot:TRINITY_DN1027_c0_g1_i1.p1 TRINITY_DN1027_c0_g1~~TRINITY_DN1027_c0_g1_i1.p1  ORF type:complete len:255 (-),score=69.88 TRINITY_DN1027_c0_g1_i1:48-743(-)